MRVGPVVVSESIDFLQLIMKREVNDLFCSELNIVFVLEQGDLLPVIHDE